MSVFDILVCTNCRAALFVDASRAELVCSTCALAYPVRDGVPVMIVDQSRSVEV